MSVLYFFESIRCTLLDIFFSVITYGGDEIVFMALGMIFFWCVDKYKGYYLLCVGFLGTVLNQFLKMLFRVPRPWVKDPNFTIVESAREAASGYSFPSGHTQTSVGLFGGVCRITSSKVLKWISVALAILVPISRMYLGVHTPADVLVSVGIALVLIFAAYPLFVKAERSPKTMYAVLISLLVIVSAFLCFVYFCPFPDEVYAADAIHNLESARKNGFTLLGCILGLIVAYTVDLKWLHFETRAVWWAQIIKVVGGLLLVLAVKELTRAPLDAIFGGTLISRAVRYFLIAVSAGIIWPLTFKWFSRLGSKDPEN